MSDVNIPKHIAIIMDGNGRWAKKRFLPRVFGHRAGVEVLRKIVKYASNVGVSYLTLYAFSSENWKRSGDEVNFLMNLLRLYIQKEINFLNENHVRVIFIGRRHEMAQDIIDLMNYMEQATAENTGLSLVLAVNYGAHNEILDAVSSLLDASKQGEITKENLQQEFEKRMVPHHIPYPDLLIRTAGEKRISNFLLWQIAYSELYFTDTLWPDFNEESLADAIDDYQTRERRYGGLV